MNLKQKCAFIEIVWLFFNFDFLIIKVNGNAQNFTFIYRDYLRNIVDIIDQDIEPCENFFQHACGNFENFQNQEREYSDSEEGEVFNRDRDVAPFLYNKQDYFKFFETHKNDFNTIPGALVRNIYDLCKSSKQHTDGSRKIWLRFINEVPFLKHDQDLLRKWPFLQYQWEKYDQQFNLNWPALAAEFTAHGLKMFFNIFFAKNTIYVTPNDELHCPDVNEFQSSLLSLLLKQRNAQIADIIGGELWLLCRQLRGEVAISGEVNEVPNLLVDEIMGEFFQHLFPRLNFTDLEIEKSRKIMVDIDRLSEMMLVLRSTNPRIIYNFILWHGYQQINIEDCFSLTEEFENLLQVEYWNWNVFKPQFSRDVALATYLFHTTRFQKHYRHIIMSSSVERLFQNRSERKDLNIERSIKNYAKDFLNLESYNTIYNSEVFSKGNRKFFGSFLEMKRLALRYSFLNPYNDSDDLSFFKEFLNFSILLFYRPRLHYFASYDREMWETSKLLQNTDGFYTALDCLERQTSVNIEDSSLYEVLKFEQVDDIFNFYTAFIESLGDYKFWLESENFAIAEDFILEYFKLDSASIMFYAVAQQFCGRNNFIYSTIINRSYMNMPEFQEAFNCSAGDEMNPLMKCMINQCL